MSMRSDYAPPDYVPPVDAPYDWHGPERRSRDPIERLGRALNRLCLEATDQYEIVAHLEALGLDRPATLRELGVADRFDLAEILYRRTPMRFERQQAARAARRPRQDLTGPLAIVLAFAVTFALGGFADMAVLAPALWVLMWSQIGATLLGSARGELARDDEPAVLALLMRAGPLGIALVWPFARFGPEAGAAALLWYGVAGLLWARRERLALALPALAGATLGVCIAWGAPPGAAASAMAALCLAFCAPLARHRTGDALRWTWDRIDTLVAPAAYGAGQGLLILALVRDGPQDAQVLHGAMLLACILFASQPLLLVLKDQLARLLWSGSSGGRFVAAARRLLTLYAGAYLLPIVLAAFVGWVHQPQPWFFHWYAFTLFGLCLALGVVSLALGDTVTPGIAFLLAGAGALAGSFLLASVLLAATQFVLLLARSARFERYAVHLL